MKKTIITVTAFFACFLLYAQSVNKADKLQTTNDKKSQLTPAKKDSLISHGLKKDSVIKSDSLVLRDSVRNDSISKKQKLKQKKNSNSTSYLFVGLGGGVHDYSAKLLNGKAQTSPLGYTFNAAYSYFINSHLGFQTGVGAQYFNQSSTFNFMSGTTVTDALSRPYELRTYYKNWEEKNTGIFLDIPLMVQYKHQFVQNLGLIASAGAKVSVPVYSKFKTSADGQIETTGYYSDWNAEFKNLPQYGFSTVNGGLDGKNKLKTGVSAIADLGLLFKVSDNADFYVGGYFGYGLTSMIDAGTKEIYQDGQYNGAFASNKVSSLKPISFGVKLGVYFEIGKKDSDKDGVPDKKDLCPNTPAEAFGLIDLHGCPLDADGDGIPDYRDKCPATPKEAFGKVDSLGCPLDTDGDSVPDYKDKCPDTPKEAIGKVDSLGCVLDTDGDGVPDYKDKCLNTPKEAIGKVDSLGCPLDTDMDGVADYLDKCPSTVKEARGAVGKDGCPLDSDGDGVLDYLDKCPKVKGVAANKGCPEVKKEIKALFKKALQGIQFETGKYIIKPVSFKLLNEIAKNLVLNPTYLVEVQGHTDNVGNRDANKELSMKRAEAVKDYLVKAGVDAKRLSSNGYGDTQPVVPNTTAKGRAQNRRVEFIVTFEEVVTK